MKSLVKHHARLVLQLAATIRNSACISALAVSMALFASAGSSEAAVRDVPSVYPTIQAAVTAADANDTIQIAAGTLVQSGSVIINKTVTLKGAGAASSVIEIDEVDTFNGSGRYVFSVAATGVIIEDLHFQRTDSPTGEHNFIFVNSPGTNLEVRNCKFSGLYDPETNANSTTRAFLISATGCNIHHNEINGLRQPGYINNTVTGQVTANYVSNTRGWVLQGGTVTFSDNTWGAGSDSNYMDIAILNTMPVPNYPNVAVLSAANNMAAVEDQREGTGDNSLFSTVFVDDSAGGAPTSINGSGVQIGSPLRPYTSIAPALARVAAGGFVKVSSGDYNEQLVVTKPLSILGATAPTKPVLNFTGTVSGRSTLIDVRAANVTIQNFQMDVDMSKLNSAVIASRVAPATTINGLQVLDNVITPYASAAGPAAGAYGNQNAIGINYGSLRVNGGGGHVTVSGNTVTGRLAADALANGQGRFFRAGVSMDECGGTFENNDIRSINQDIQARFGVTGQSIQIQNNQFKGGGVELAEHNAGVTGLSVVNNSFDGEMAIVAVTPRTAILRLKNNQSGIPTTITGNTFTKHNWAISLENYKNVTVSGNAFTPGVVSSYRHITVNTKSISSNSASIVQTTISANITGNTFNNSTPSSPGTAIAFYNHDSDAAAFGAFTVTGNIFNAGIGTFILLDGNSGNTPGPFPEYTGVSTLMAPWATNLDAANNSFDIGSGAKLPSAMSDTELFALEDRISHRSDAANLGVVRVKATELYVTATGSIQRMIGAAAAGDIVNVGPGTYSEDVLVTESLTLKGSGAATTTIIGPIGGTGSDTVRINASNATVEGFTITRAGNNTADWNNANGTLNGTGVAIQGPVYTGNVIRNNTITGMRTAIDINNSSGHSVLNNVIANNRTGLLIRNLTDNLIIEENEITENWTVGILFLDGSAPPNGVGTNDPVQRAAGCSITNNNISGNWYGQIVDRQTDGALPLPGDNVKNLSGNWLGTDEPVVSANNSVEPGYADLIPLAFGGTATAPGGQPDICGRASANIDYSPLLIVPTDTNVETSPGRGTHGFQGDFTSPKLVLTCPQDGAPTYSRIQEMVDFIKTGGIVQVPAATYPGNVNTSAKSVTLAAGSSPGKVVIDGDLVLDGNDTLPIEVGGTTAGTQHDQWEVTGAVTLGGASVTFTAVNSFIPATGNAFTFLSKTGAGAIVGEFNGLPQNAGLPAFLGSASDAYASYTAGDGNDFVVSVGPELVVEQGTEMNSGDDRDFGVVPIQGGHKAMVFTLKNIGAPGLVFSASPRVQITGSAAFTVTSQPASPLSGPLGSTTFIVQFAPGTVGAHAATISIESNDLDESPFTIDVTGQGVEGNFFNESGTIIAGLPMGGTAFTLTANATSYILTRTAGSGNWAGIDDLVVSGHNTNTLTILKAGLTQVIIGDGTTAADLTLAVDSGASFQHTFQIRLDNSTSSRGTFTFPQSCPFTNNSSLIASTTRNSALGFTIPTGGVLSAAGTGNISLTGPIITTGAGSTITAADGAVALVAGTSLTISTESIVSSTTGNVVLTAGALNTHTITANSKSSITAGGTITATAGGAITIGIASPTDDTDKAVVTGGGLVTLDSNLAGVTVNQYSEVTSAGSVTLEAQTSISVQASSKVRSTGTGAVSLTATANNITTGNLAQITSAGGDVTLNATGIITPNTATFATTGAGDVLLQSGGTLNTSATVFAASTESGTLTLKSTGSSVTTGASSITTEGGNLELNAGTSATVSGNAVVKANGTGAVSIRAVSNITVGTLSQITSAGGDVTLNAGGAFAPGTGTFATTGSGNILIQSAGLWNNGATAFTATTESGSVTLKSTASGVSSGASTITTTGGNIAFEGNSVALGACLVEVLAGGGNISLVSTVSTVNTGNNSTLRTVDGSISAISASTLAAGISSLTETTGTGAIYFESSTGTININAGSLPTPTRLRTVGEGGITLTTPRDILIGTEASISVVNGNVLLSANQQVAPTAGGFTAITSSGTVSSSGLGAIQILGKGGSSGNSSRGILLTGSDNERGQVLSTGVGTVTLVGTNGGSGLTAGTCHGIHLSGSTVKVDSSLGALSLAGTSSAYGSNASHHGIYMENGAKVQSTNASVSLTGLSGTPAANGSNYGIHLTGANTQVTTAFGSITLNGTSRAVGTSTSNIGVRMEAGAQVGSTASSSVPIVINGTGANSTRTATDSNTSNHGVYLTGTNTKISTAKGSVVITGTGGNFIGASPVLADHSMGIFIANDAEISSSDDASITLVGTAGTGGDDNQYGVYINDTSATTLCRVSSVNGNISITGTSGGSDANSANTDGVRFEGVGVEVASTGSGLITINGSRPVPTTNGAAFSVISGARVIHSTGVGGLVINADTINIASPAVLDVGSNAVTLRPATPARAINLGAADDRTVSGFLGLTDAELDRITAGTITIGAANSGTITISAEISRTAPATPTNLVLVSGANIIQSALVNAGATGSLTVNATAASGNYQPGVGSVNADVIAATTTVTSGTKLPLSLASYSASSPFGTFDRLNVTGAANIANVDLVLSNTGYTPVLGHAFNLVSASGGLTGEFFEKPNNHTYLNFFGSDKSAVLTYTANAAVLTVTGQPEIAVHDGSSTAAPELTDGQAAPVDFGSTTLGVSKSRDFTIHNPGTGVLTITSITPPATGGFTVLNAPTSVPAGGSATFQVQLNGDVGASFSGDVTITSNDPTPMDAPEGVFTFRVIGTSSASTDQVVLNGSILSVGVANTLNTDLVITVNVLNSTTYTLVRNTGNWTDTNILTLGPGISGHNTSTLTIQKSAVTEVRILDAEESSATGKVRVTFAGRGTAYADPAPAQTFDDSFTVRLDSADAGIISFTGVCDFTGSNFLNAFTHASVEQSTNSETALRRISVEEGDLTLIANRGPVATTMAGHGVSIAGTVITTGGGDILINGRGGDGATGRNGILITGSAWGSGGISSTSVAGGAGTITLIGTGGPFASTNNSAYGICLTGTTAGVSSTLGDIVLTGTSDSTGSGSNNHGIYITSGAHVRATGTVAAVNITLNGNSAVASAASGSNYGVHLNGAATEISSAKGNIDIVGVSNAATTGSNNSGVFINSAKVMAASGVEPVEITITGNGAATTGASTTSHGVIVTGTGAEVVSRHLPVSITGVSHSTGSGNRHPGVEISTGAKIHTQGVANLTITGESGASTVASANNSGVLVSGAGTEVYTAQGNINLIGTSKAVSTGGSNNNGVYVLSGAKIRSESTAADTLITIQGNSAPTGAASTNSGVAVNGGGTEVLSARGTIDIDGVSTAAALSDGIVNMGVRLDGGAKVRSSSLTNPVAISIDGTGADSTRDFAGAASNYGVYIMNSGTQVQTAKGSITIRGFGGDLLASSQTDQSGGVRIADNVEISSTDDAPILIEGTAGLGGDDDMIGVWINDSSPHTDPEDQWTRISSKSGLVTIRGISGGTAAIPATSTGCDGVRLDSNGVRLYSETSADFEITGTKLVANTTGNAFATTNAARVISAGSGKVTVNADTIALSTGTSGCQFNMGAASVAFVPTTNGRSIEIGGTNASPADTAGTVLGLINGETARVLSGTCIIGNTLAGPITVNGPVTMASNVNLSLVSSGDITQNNTSNHATTGTLATSGTGTVKLTSVNGKVKPLPDALPMAGVLPDVTGDLTFGVGTDLEIMIKGLASVANSEDTNGYRQLTVSGNLNIDGVNLIVTEGSYVPVDAEIGRKFVIATASYPVTGMFANTLFDVVPNINGSNFGGKIILNDGGNNVTLQIVGSPELVVESDGPPVVELTDEQATPVSFGTPFYLQPVEKTFTLSNTGTETLTVTAIDVPAGYTLVSPAVSPMSPINIFKDGASVKFTVRFDAATVTTVAGNVVIHSNDVDETQFSFPVTGTVSNFVTDNAGGGLDTVTAVADGGRTITVRVPPASPLIGGQPGDQFYRLVLNTGTWNGTDVSNVVSGHGTNTLTIRKSGVANVSIIDAAGANAVTFEGRASAASGRTFDDNFTVLLDNDSAGTITFSGNCEFTGESSLNAETFRNIVQNTNTALTVVDGDLTLKAGFGTVPMSTNTDGMGISGEISTAGKGDILLTGRGSSSTQCWGITVGTVHGTSGKILSTGLSNDAGSITLNGAGGPNTGSSASGHGVYLNGATIEISSFRGAITVNGTSPALGSGGSHMGLVMRNGAQIIDKGSAAIILNGTGAAAPSNSNYGVFLSDTNTRVIALNGSITINGIAGGDGDMARDNQRGVLIEANAQVLSTGTASITITGTGGTGDDNHVGVAVRGVSPNVDALISSVNGNIVINGTGGGFSNALSIGNYGILINGGTISSTGAATIALNATEGSSPTLLTNESFAMLGAESKLTTAAGTGAVTITANKVAIDPTNATLALGTNSITLKPLTAARSIDLGGADTASTLGLTDAELDRITTAGAIVIGSAQAGAVTVSAAISPASNAGLSLVSSGDIVQNSGGTLTTSGAVSFATSGVVRPAPSGLDVTASTVTFGNGATLALPFNALTPVDSETGYRRLTVSNGVDLTGVNLEITGPVPGTPPALGDSFILVANNSTAPESTTVGTFNGLPEGHITYDFLGSGMNVRISYVGGTDANDVVLTVAPQEIAVGQPTGTGLVHNVSIVDYGAVNILGIETKTFTITNLGAQDLEIDSIMSDNPEFVVDDAGVSPSLVPGATTTFKVSFAPVAGGPGARSGSISISSNDPAKPTFGIGVAGTVITRNAEKIWAEQYSGPDAAPRNGDAKAVAIHKSGNTVTAVFATGYTTNAAGNKDIYVMKYDPVSGAPDPVWTSQPDTIYNGPTNRDDEGSALVVDSNGDVIVAGLTTVAPSNSDVWVAKYSGATGERLWSHTYNGYLSNVDYATSIAVEANGNVAVAGATVTGSGNYDMYVVKLSAAGAVIWENALDGGSNRSDIANKVLMDSAGNVFVAGYKGNSSNRKISFAAKLSAAAGNVLWTHQRVGSAVLDDMLYGLALDANDNLVVAGSLYAAGSYDLYVAKLQGDSAGPAATVMWETVTDPFGNNDSFYDVVVDGDGHVVAAGTSRNASNLHERIVAKYDGSTGVRLWDTRLNQGLSTSGDRAFNAQLALDGANNVAVTGFAVSSTNDGTLDVYTAKVMTADGALLWAETHPSPAVAGKNDEGRDVAASFNGDFYVAGYSGNPSASTSDFLVMKYGVAAPSQQLANPIVFTTEEIQSVGTTVRLQATAPGGVVRYSVVSGGHLATALSGPNSDTLTFTGVGQVVIRGSQGGNSQYAPATDTDLIITVRDSQTIAFTLAENASKNDTVTLEATASSGLPVSFSVQSGPGSITGGNILEFSDAGEVVVRASQAGDNDYAAATPVDRAITVTDGAPVIIMPGIEQTWAAISPGTGAGQARSVALDMTGGVWNGGAVTTGFTTRAGTGVDLRTAKHDAAGALVWETIRSVNLADEGVMVKVDNAGNVFVAGYTTVGGTNTDVLVIKYDSAGVQQWQRTFTGTAAGGGADRAVGLMLTSAGDVVVAGYLVNVTTGLDFFAAKLNSSDGTVAWSQSYDGGFNKIDVVNALALTAADEVVLAGYSQDASNNEDALTLKVPAAGGAAIWTRRFAGVTGMADRINAVALGADGDVFVTGYTQGANIDIYSARYKGADGAEEWKSIYNGPANKNDAAYDLKVDLAGNVVIAATASDVNAVNDGLTLKLNGTTGAVIWNAFYAGPAGKTDRMSVVGLDPNGHVIATGYSLIANNTSDIYTAKYDKNTGAELWAIRYNGADLVRNDSCNAMVTDSLGGAWVAGYMSNTSNVSAPLLLRYAPPMPPPPPPPLDEESGESESSLGTLLEVAQGDAASFTAEFAAASGNEEVRLQASINGQSAGEMIVDAKNGRFNWSQDTSRIAPGLHPVVITATDRAGASTSVSLALQVKPSTPGRSWRFKNFGSTDATGAAADDADPDGDGLSNLAEFALGLNPKAGSGDTGIRAEAAPAAPDVMRAVFNRRTDYVAAGLRYVVEFSSNLATWTASTDTPELLSDDGTIQKLSLPFPVLPDGSTARFFRVQIETVAAPQE